MLERYDRPVRCKAGHLFTTIWIPLAPVKAVRLGGTRYQYCPVGRHWSAVTPLDAPTAATADLRAAASVHDVRLP